MIARERRYYTVSEAASVLDVSRTTVWRWIADGRLAAYRAGGRTIRIKREDLERFLRPARLGTKRQAGERLTRENLWDNYDPKKALRALRRTAGILKGVDIDALLKDIHEARGQADRHGDED